MGANFNYIKIIVFIALRFNFHLVWNPANFVSENTPQYVGASNALAVPLSTLPGDTFSTFGFDLYAPSARATPADIYDRIARGELVARPIDDFDHDVGEWPMQEGKANADAFARKLEAVMQAEGWNAEGAKERAIIIRSCQASYRGWDIGGVGTWLRDVFHTFRLHSRKVLPMRTLAANTYVIGVHVRIGDCKFERWKKQKACKTLAWKRTVNSLFHTPIHEGSPAAQNVKLQCEGDSASGEYLKSRLAIVAEATVGDIGSNFVKKYESCTDLVLSSPDDPAVKSARAVFDALDVLSISDVLVLSHSSFSRLAGALAAPSTIKLVPFEKNELWARTSWSGVHNVLEICASGEKRGLFERKKFANVWKTRHSAAKGGEANAPMRSEEFCAKI
jgi:hypothetical protein